MRRARSGNLTALLVVVSVLEFIVNRLAGRLFFPRPALSSGGSGSNAIHAISWVGPWLFQLTAILALAVMVAAFIGLFRRGELYPRAMRFSTMVVAAVLLVPVGVGGVHGRHQARDCSCGPRGASRSWLLLTAIAFVAPRRRVRLKLGVVTLALPGRAARLRLRGVAARRPRERRSSPAARRALAAGGPPLLEAGAIAVLLAGLLAPLLLPPRPFTSAAGTCRWRSRRR